MELRFDVFANSPARPRELARHGGFVLADQPADLRQREVLRVVTAKPQAVARRQPQYGPAECLPDEPQVARPIRVGRRRRLDRTRRFLVWKRREPASGTQAIDVALCEDGTEPCSKAASAMKVTEERAVQIRVKRIGDLAGAA